MQFDLTDAATGAAYVASPFVVEDVVVQDGLALLYRHGQGVRENIDITMDWLRKVAEKGDERALMFFEDLRC